MHFRKLPTQGYFRRKASRRATATNAAYQDIGLRSAGFNTPKQSETEPEDVRTSEARDPNGSGTP